MNNNPIQVLFDEHEIIKSVIDAASHSSSLLGEDDARYEKIVRRMIEFFRNYADKFHHYKEEAILFPEMSKKNELLQGGVIQEMLENHSDFRDMIKSIEKFLDDKNYMRARQQLDIYCEALLDHIAVENDEVFQSADSLLSPNELESMFFRFTDCDEDLGEAYKNELVKMAEEIRAEFTNA